MVPKHYTVYVDTVRCLRPDITKYLSTYSDISKTVDFKPSPFPLPKDSITEILYIQLIQLNAL